MVELLEQQQQQMQIIVTEEWAVHGGGKHPTPPPPPSSSAALPHPDADMFCEQPPAPKMMSFSSGRLPKIPPSAR
jgi:hypothetical protein